MYITPVLLCIVLSLCSCIGPGLGDWQYDLPNGYSIWHINSCDICLVRYYQLTDENDNPVFDENGEKVYDNTGGSIAVEGHIIGFQYNERYVGVKRVNVPEDVLDYMEIDRSNPEYCLVDTLTEDVYAMMSDEGYADALSKLGVKDMSEWLTTQPSPKDAVYPI